MIVVMKRGATKEQIKHVCDRIKDLGYRPHPIYGVERTVIGAIGDERGKVRLQSLESLEGVERVVPILHPFKLAGRELKKERTIIRVGDIQIGGNQFVVIAGPCAVESRDQIMSTAKEVKKAGATFLRGGAFKPRTSPYSFQGLQKEGLELLAEAREQTGLAIVTEVLTPEDIPLVAQYADILQVGARNMMNSPLLRQLGKVNKPVLLKRGMMATVKELLMSAEYVIAEGNSEVILCERGIRTFEEYTRNTLDLSAVPMLKELSHLPVIVDPSHGCGMRSLVVPMSKAAVAAGADGLMIEVHPNPEEAYSDGPQSLLPEQFEVMMKEIRRYLELEGKHL
ncbi:MAG TPA: 3-deoxy-7-phosphoheptulonate synthase [Candidatus Latescibacteria bacterium]|nr:3-deoxy-7-phosphoheptulonate synthase [Candidatus Latescibacterota bacterium]